MSTTCAIGQIEFLRFAAIRGRKRVVTRNQSSKFNMIMVMNVFAAGCVGALVLQVCFPDSPLYYRAAATELPKCVAVVLSRALLAGYVAAGILALSQPLHGFLLGLGIDYFLSSARKNAVALAEGQHHGVSTGNRMLR